MSGLEQRLAAAKVEADRREREGRDARLGADKQALSERATAILGGQYEPGQVGDDGVLQVEDKRFRLPPQGVSGLTLLEEGDGDFTFHTLSAGASRESIHRGRRVTLRAPAGWTRERERFTMSIWSRGHSMPPSSSTRSSTSPSRSRIYGVFTQLCVMADCSQ